MNEEKNIPVENSVPADETAVAESAPAGAGSELAPAGAGSELAPAGAGSELAPAGAGSGKTALIPAPVKDTSEKPKRRINKKLLTIGIPVLVLALLLGGGLSYYLKISSEKYEAASALFRRARYEEAAEAFGDILIYKDSLKMEKESIYRQAEKLYRDESYDEAAELYRKLGNYNDSKQRAEDSANLAELTRKYDEAMALYNDKDFESALAAFTELGSFKSSSTYAKKAATEIENAGKYDEATKLYESAEYRKAYELFKELRGYKDSTTMAQKIYNNNFSLVEQLRVADINTRFFLYEDSIYSIAKYDDGSRLNYKDIPFIVVAKEENRVLLGELYVKEPPVINYSFAFWSFDDYDTNYPYAHASKSFKTSEYKPSFFIPEIRSYIDKKGTFIPDVDFFNKYIKNSAVNFSDGYCWIVTDGTSSRGLKCTYAGTNKKIGGTGFEIVFREFMWINLPEEE